MIIIEFPITSINYRARPVAVVEASTTFDVESKLISLDDKKCTTVRDHKQVPCTAINSCLKYNGINLPATIGKFFVNSV